MSEITVLAYYISANYTRSSVDDQVKFTETLSYRRMRCWATWVVCWVCSWVVQVHFFSFLLVYPSFIVFYVFLSDNATKYNSSNQHNGADHVLDWCLQSWNCWRKNDQLETKRQTTGTTCWCGSLFRLILTKEVIFYLRWIWFFFVFHLFHRAVDMHKHKYRFMVNYTTNGRIDSVQPICDMYMYMVLLKL